MHLNVQETFQKLDTDGRKQSHDNGLEELIEYDEKLLEIGCTVFKRHFFSMFVSMLAGLLSLMYIPTIVQVLQNTRESSTPERAFQRYLRTLNHVIKWYQTCISDQIKSLKVVRRTHANVAKKEAMSQFDMVITQWAFIAPTLLKPQELGIDPISEEELDGLRYVIYCVGKSIGIEDDLNLCKNDLQQTKEYSHLILKRIIQPALKEETEQNNLMADNLLQGMHLLNPYLIPQSLKAWTFQLFEVKYDQGRDCISFYLVDKILSSVLHGTTGKITRPIFSYLMRINIILANKWEKHILIKSRRPIM